ncbi:cell division topological specificity factor mine [Desulfoluna butyratoxydans]|uniref:Cell division topological specificity factor n=2 Tax=Desulfoluna butyratoxydans TaxID=231438 RepID=A0A4U8YSM5_9BACT|nr:cell division topological specificity factor mine [Desulfoluna butyratoxydans]
MLNNLLQKMMGSKEEPRSSEVARKRLKLALVCDSLEVSDEVLSNLREDLLKVISSYFEIDRAGFSLDIDKTDDYSALVMNTPILSSLRR